MFKSILILLATASLSMIACKKDDEKSTDPTNADLITEVSCWRPDKQERFEASTNTLDTEIAEPCISDNCYTFYKNGNLILDEGVTKCELTDPQSVTAEWSISADGTTITLIQAGDVQVATIVTLNSTALTLQFDEGGGDYYRLYFKK